MEISLTLEMLNDQMNGLKTTNTKSAWGDDSHLVYQHLGGGARKIENFRSFDGEFEAGFSLPLSVHQTCGLTVLLCSPSYLLDVRGEPRISDPIASRW